jgi:hypothetical protein
MIDKFWCRTLLTWLCDFSSRIKKINLWEKTQSKCVVIYCWTQHERSKMPLLALFFLLLPSPVQIWSCRQGTISIDYFPLSLLFASRIAATPFLSWIWREGDSFCFPLCSAQGWPTSIMAAESPHPLPMTLTTFMTMTGYISPSSCHHWLRLLISDEGHRVPGI